MKVTIRAMRVNRNLKQSDAARKIGVNPGTLNNWEQNKTFPTIDNIMKICEVYECEIDDLILPSTLS